jgi:sec-independent protein translocase protein TatA
MGPQELIVIGVIAILLFGKKLPEVARKVGGSYREFRKGINDMQSSYRDTTSSYMQDVDDNYSPGTGYAGEAGEAESSYDDYDEATAPKFEPPPAEPQSSDPAASDGAGDGAGDGASDGASDGGGAADTGADAD